MIPPVDRASLDEMQDEYDRRPEWIKWYYARWVSATQMMDPEQKGWYINLLMHAAIQGEPPGYLPNDDEELRYIAGIKSLRPEGPEKKSKHKKWERVKSKFRVSTEFPELVYNKLLVTSLKEAHRKSTL